MRTRDRIVVLLLAGAIVLLALLAIGINGLKMQPGRPFNIGDLWPASSSGPALLSEGGEINSDLIRIVFIALAALVPLVIVLSLLTPDGRRQLLGYVMMAAAFILVMNLLQPRQQNPRDDTVNQQALQAAPEPGLAEAPTDVFRMNTPDWLVFAVSVAIALLVCGILLAVIWLAWRRSHPPKTPLEELAQEAQTAMNRLHAGAELKDTILRCYREMVRVLQQQRGIQRQAAMTAREFESALLSRGLPAQAVQQLTRLFEQVRYGRERLGAQEEALAVASLSAIVAACGNAQPGQRAT